MEEGVSCPAVLCTSSQAEVAPKLLPAQDLPHNHRSGKKADEWSGAVRRTLKFGLLWHSLDVERPGKGLSSKVKWVGRLKSALKLD